MPVLRNLAWCSHFLKQFSGISEPPRSCVAYEGAHLLSPFRLTSASPPCFGPIYKAAVNPTLQDYPSMIVATCTLMDSCIYIYTTEYPNDNIAQMFMTYNHIKYTYIYNMHTRIQVAFRDVQGRWSMITGKSWSWKGAIATCQSARG